MKLFNLKIKLLQISKKHFTPERVLIKFLTCYFVGELYQQQAISRAASRENQG